MRIRGILETRRILFPAIMLIFVLLNALSPAQSEGGKDLPSGRGGIKSRIAPGSRELIKNHLKVILESQEFRARPNPSSYFWEKCEESILSFISFLSGSKPSLTLIFWLVFISLLLFGIWTGIILFSSMKGKWIRERAPHVPGAARDKIPQPEELKKEAENFAGSGNYRDGVRSLYLASLLIMDRKMIIEYEKSKTNWEYLDMTEKNSSVSEPFLAFTQFFDEKWYGQKPCSREDFQCAKKLMGEIVSLC